MRRLAEWLFVLLIVATSEAALSQQQPAVRIAWQPIGTIQGHAGVIFEQTNVFAINRLRGEMTPFMTGGAPLNEGLAAGQFDVATYGLGPCIAAMARGIPTKLVVIMNYFRAGMLVNTDSPIKRVADLRGKKVGVAYGSGVHRTAIEMLRGAGLNAGRDVELVNLGPSEAATALRRGEVDAWVMWDPTYTDLLQQKLARSLGETDSKAQFNSTVMTAEFIAKHERAAIDFLKAQQMALWYMANNKDLTSSWMAKRVPIRLEAIKSASSYDRNWNATRMQDVDMSFHESDIQKMQEEARFLYDNKFVPKLVDMRAHIDLTLYQKARKELEGMHQSPQILITKR